jgi:hypothetical protein
MPDTRPPIWSGTPPGTLNLNGAVASATFTVAATGDISSVYSVTGYFSLLVGS